MKRKATVLSCLLVVLTGACSEDEGIVGVYEPGATARVVLAHVQAAGGSVYQETITIDSATARFQVLTCTHGVSQSACTSSDQRSGDVPQGMLDQLFTMARSSEFRKLRDQYERPGDIIPPDGSSSSLTVTVGERTRAIAWDGGAELPEALLRFECWVHSARGSLGLCG